MVDEQTMFLKKREFDEVKGRLTFENPTILNNFNPQEEDIIAIEFTINSSPLIKSLEIIKKGNFVSFWGNRFEKEGVSKQQLKEAFSIEDE